MSEINSYLSLGINVNVAFIYWSN